MWGTYSEYGYYYTWKSTYTGNTSLNNTDPCPKLKSDYGTGWRTPSKDEMDKLSRCTNKAVVTSGGNKGFWFMNSTIGLFLPFGGSHGGATGSKTTPPAMPVQKELTGALMLMVQHMVIYYIYYWLVNPERPLSKD